MSAITAKPWPVFGYAIIHPNGQPLWNTFQPTRAWAIKEWAPDPKEWMAWKRSGYRSARVKLEEVSK